MTKRVLIIDDEPAVCTMLRGGFESAGYEVQTAGDGNQGIRLFRKHFADLVITDLLMPEKMGWNLFENSRGNVHS